MLMMPTRNLLKLTLKQLEWSYTKIQSITHPALFILKFYVDLIQVLSELAKFQR